MVKSALVLCGGGSKGAFEVGVLKVLMKRGWKPDIVIGTSVGAINGAIMLDGPDLMENVLRMEQLWFNVTKKDFFRFNRALFYKFHLASSFYSHENMLAYLRKYLKANLFKDLNGTLYVNCTRLSTGHSIMFHAGDLIEPIAASSSVPPLLAPYKIGDEFFCDGGMGSYLGIDTLKRFKFKKIVIVNLASEEYVPPGKSIIEISRHAIEIIRHNFIHREIEMCKGKQVVTITPHLEKDVSMLDFSRTKELIALGEKEAKKALRRIIR